jgi:hypothetical protein
VKFLRGCETGGMELENFSAYVRGWMERRRLREQVLARLQATIRKGVRLGDDYITLGTEQCLSR